MDTSRAEHWKSAETDAQAETGFPPRQRPERAPRDYPLSRQPHPALDDYPRSRPPSPALRDYPASGQPRAALNGYPPSRALHQDPRGYPSGQSSAQVASRPAPVPPVSLQLDEQPPAQRQRRRQTQFRRVRTWPQRLGGGLIAGACVVCAAWYVPRVISDNRHLLTGTVVSSGVVTLNFPGSGEIATVDVRLGQLVRKGQMLASQYAPNADALVAADKAAIAAQQAKIAELEAAEAADPAAAPADSAQIAADKAQLALDHAQMVTDRMRIAAAEIVAPSAGIVVAVNGQPGQAVTSSGIRYYAADSRQAPASQQPPFSLVPEGPQPVRHTATSGSALPVIALRVSATWYVVALIPEDSVSAIKAAQHVTISVPAAGISGLPGRIDEVLPTPAATSGGAVYQAVVTLTGRAADLPLNGMAADIQLDS